MVYLCLAVLCSAAINIVMRLSTDKVQGNVAMLFMNYVMCFLIAGTFTGWDQLLPQGGAIGGALLMGGMQGLLYLGAFVLLQLNIRKNGVVLSAIFQRLGLLVPMVVSIFLFREIPSGVQILGFCVAIAAIVLINLEKEQTVIGFKAGLFMLLLCAGGADVMAKLYEELGDPTLAPQFLLYTFGLALVLCLGLMLWKKQRPGKAEAIYGFAVGIPNYFSAKFLLASLQTVPAVIVYPTYSVATIFVVSIIGVLVFGERLSKRQWLGIGIILAALVLLNI